MNRDLFQSVENVLFEKLNTYFFQPLNCTHNLQWQGSPIQTLMHNIYMQLHRDSFTAKLRGPEHKYTVFHI